MKAVLNLTYSLALIGFTTAALAIETPDKSKVFFQENKGQICDQNYNPRPDVKFSGSVNGLNYHLTETGISYQLSHVNTWEAKPRIGTSDTYSCPGSTSIYRVDVKWIGTSSSVMILPGNLLEGVNNYYMSHCSNGVINVKSYDNLMYKEIYSGIDLKWYEKNGDLEYDYIVKPGGRISDIKFEISGAGKLKINSKGALEITTPLGVIVQKSPVAFQDGKSVNVKFNLKGNTIGFEVSNYNKSKTLIIDPAIVQWSTYYGNTGADHLQEISGDASGLYSVGFTASTSTLIATTGAHQTTNGGGTDGMLVKFNSSGARLWATYYGGGGSDLFVGCQVDNAGNIIAVGNTQSINMATTGAYQTTYAGGDDGLVVKFNSSGVRQWSTYYGTINTDEFLSVATDNSGNVFVGGFTISSGTVLSTPGAHQINNGGLGFYDGLLVKFNATGVRQYATYLGGTNHDYIQAVSVSSTGDVMVAGYANSTSTNIASPGAYQAVNNGGNDAFLAKFNNSGVRQWGTYFGGTATDQATDCQVDGSGNVYLVGITNSTNNIATTGAFQTTKGSGNDGMIAKFNAGGVLQWATYYGDVNNDDLYKASINSSSELLITGQTSAPNYHATPSAHQLSYAGGIIDGFLTKFDASGNRVYSTYLGGTGTDYIMSVEGKVSGGVYVCGVTTSSVGISTPASFQSTITNTLNEGFVTKFIECAEKPLSIASSNTFLCKGTSASLSAIGSGYTSYSWSPIGSTSSSISVTPTTTITYTLFANTSTVGCVYKTVQTITVDASASMTVISNPTTGAICNGQSVLLYFGGSPTTQTWQPGGSTLPSISVSPMVTTTYSVTGTSTLNGCTSTETITINVTTTPTLITTNYTICPGGTITLSASGAPTYSWSTGATTPSISVSPTANTTYTVRGTNGTCSDVNSITVTTGTALGISIAPTTPTACFGNPVTVTANGATSYTWSTGANSSSISVTPTVSITNYTVNATNGTCSGTRTINVIGIAPPTVSATSSSSALCIGSSATLIANGASTYTWNPGNVVGSTLAITPTITTTYTVVGRNGSGCTNTKTITINVSPCTGLSELQTDKSQIIVYPNPNNGQFTVEFANQGTYSLVNVLGQTIQQFNIGKGKTQIVEISEMADGVYYLVGNNRTFKIVVNRGH